MQPVAGEGSNYRLIWAAFLVYAPEWLEALQVAIWHCVHHNYIHDCVDLRALQVGTSC